MPELSWTETLPRTLQSAGPWPNQGPVRVVFPGVCLRVEELLALLRPQQDECFVWLDGRSGTQILALGVALDFCGQGPVRFQEAARACSRWCEQVQTRRLDIDILAPMRQKSSAPCGPVEVSMPLAWAGFGFRDTGLSGEPWEGWAASRAVVPSVLFVQRPQEQRASLAVTLPSASSPQEAARRIQALCAPLLQRVLAPLHTRDLHPQDFRAQESHPTSSNASQEQWCALVGKARTSIRQGNLDKVVLARAVDYTPSIPGVFDGPATALRLWTQNPEATVFGCGGPHQGFFVGATPESLIRVQGRRIETQALAGTAPRSAEAAEDHRLGQELLQSQKNQREHILTSQTIARALRPLCAEFQIAPEPQLVKLPLVQHLETSMEGYLRAPTSILGLVARLHPTPAVGGLPAAQALAWLRAHEGLARGWYASPLGWLDTSGHSGAFVVAIRSALLQGNTARAFTGAGIVAASVPEYEWRETQLKLQTVARELVVRPL